MSAKPLLTFLFSFIAYLGISQKVVYTSPPIAAVPAPVTSDNNINLNYPWWSKSLLKATVYPSTTEAVTVYDQHKKQGALIIKVNEDGKVLWQHEMADEVIFIGMHQGSVALVTIPEWNKQWGLIPENVKITLLNTDTGRPVAERVLFSTKPDVFIDIKVLYTKDAIKGLLLRHTDLDQNRSRNPYTVFEKAGATRKVEILDIDEELNTGTPRKITTAATSMEYLGGGLNQKGELIMVSCSENILLAEKFGVGAVTPVAKLMASFDAKEKKLKTGHVVLNRDNPDQVAVALKYKNAENDDAIASAIFDFTAGKGYSHLVNLEEKAYRKALDIKNTDYFTPATIIFYGDKIIFCKEQTNSWQMDMKGAATRYNAATMLLSVYDKNMRLVKDILVPRRYEAFDRGQLHAGFFINGNKLSMLFSELAGSTSYQTVLSEVDLDKLEISRRVILERSGIHKASTIEAESSLWFGNAVVLPYIEGAGGMLSTKLATILQKIQLK